MSLPGDARDDTNRVGNSSSNRGLSPQYGSNGTNRNRTTIDSDECNGRHVESFPTPFCRAEQFADERGGYQGRDCERESEHLQYLSFLTVTIQDPDHAWQLESGLSSSSSSIARLSQFGHIVTELTVLAWFLIIPRNLAS